MFKRVKHRHRTHPKECWRLGLPMESQNINLEIDLIDLSSRLLAAQEVVPRARIIAHTIAELLPGTAVNTYVLFSANGDQDRLPKDTVGTIYVQPENVSSASEPLVEL